MPTSNTANTGASIRNMAMLNELKQPSRSVPLVRRHDTAGSEAGNAVNGDRIIPTAELFGCNVYSLSVMQKTLPKAVFARLAEKMAGGEKILDKDTSEAVAHAVRVWAMERGATHFTHWFQPQNNRTAEKHDAFLTLKYDFEHQNLKVTAIDAFSGSQLVQAEPDASSFPHGGMRTTFEARGYTVWDTTSPMFLREGPHGTKILYIPSVFISYTGEALDEKTVLLRSCQAISDSTKELIKLVSGQEVSRIHVTLGTEQEFFLVDRAKYALRPDLRLTGRSLFGIPPPRHQQLEDHYFGTIPSRVLAALSEAEFELWKLGVPVKTRHNEVAPGQFEVAPVFEEASVAVDHNHLTMDVLGRVAHRHGLKALFHEKPFKGVNGSGKHCNWSLSTDAGENLLEPGENPEENPVFLAVLASILLGMHRHGGLLSCAIMSASNEHRLGAHEAPPSIVSAFLGEHLDAVVRSVINGKPVERRTSHTYESIPVGAQKLDLKVAHLPEVKRDTTDRNRTSPMAFTGNKFEFRAVGSSQSPSFPVTILNSIAAAGMQEVSAALKAKGSNLSRDAIMAVLAEKFKESERMRFEGNGYSAEWVTEAERRGLLNARNAPVAFLELVRPENRKALVEQLAIMTLPELQSRFRVLNEKYVQLMAIEGKMLGRLATQHISPAAFSYCKDVAAGMSILTAFAPGKLETLETQALPKLLENSASLAKAIAELEEAVEKVEALEDPADAARLAAETLRPAMAKARSILDSMEALMADDAYPFPKYRELLF